MAWSRPMCKPSEIRATASAPLLPIVGVESADSGAQFPTTRYDMADTEQSLYQKLGGEAGVAKLISAFYIRVLDDKALSPFFQNVSIEALKRMQQDFFAMALGETTAYAGRSLAEAHHGRGIHPKHVGLFVQHLLGTLRESGVSEEHVDEVISHIDVHTNEITGQSY